ncbi:MAG: hypothetical protein R2794_12950, partial [Chitinophagales bacterium]
FDLIDAQGDKYDEGGLRIALRKKEDIAMLPRLKVYLSDLILKSMRLYRSEKNAASEVFDLIQDELFYTDKGLLELRAKTIKKAKDLAYKYDLMYLLMAVLQRERTFSILYTDGDPMEAIDNIHTEEQTVLERLNNEAELGRIFFSILAKFMNSQVDHQESLRREAEAYRKNPLMQDYNALKTFQEKVFFLHAHTYICRILEDIKGALEYSRETISLYEAFPQHTYNVTGTYMDALSNYLALSHRAGIYDAFVPVLEKLEKLQADNQKDKVSISGKVIQYKILYVLNTRHFEMVDAITDAFEEYIATYGKIIPVATYLTANYNIAILYFMRGDMDKAMFYCRRVTESNSDKRIELQHGSALLEYILHFELGNLLFLDSQLRNGQRNMQNAGTYTGFEKLFFTYLRKLLKTGATDQADIFAEMHAELLHFKQVQKDKKDVLMLETLAWTLHRSNGSDLVDNMFLDYDAG